MSKPAPRHSSTVRTIWRLINLTLLAIGFFTPIVQDQTFGTIHYLNILSIMLIFLPGVIFQAIAIPTKLPGLFLYLGGLLSLISLIVYAMLESLALIGWRKKRKTIRSLFLITMSGIGVFAVLFLWQGHLTHGAWILVTGLVSCLILEAVERFKPSR
ncbi:hypothetical protein ACQ4M3_24890 [Leptolyngbya sp. AN03gr2]|uniref:hypothetical protein n=1 Tax=unclassified Leptolyngbya TaxID=2650499 RepID=UPI003D322EEB